MKLGHLLSQGALFIACAWGCDQSTPPPTSNTGQSTQSMEWVGYHTEVPWAANDFHALISGLVGPDAQNGKFLSNQQVTPGVFLTAMAETATNAQSRVALTYNDGTSTPRTLALVPASFSVGTVSYGRGCRGRDDQEAAVMEPMGSHSRAVIWILH